ncbi:N-acetylglucosamine-6-phosphate deacetylase [Burkholderiaceae bacterium DAT-1]|nr:N-acetylglucosamine-6-phosphate deacetylase [Burkholderiaceae bacterium DAT-1]
MVSPVRVRAARVLTAEGWLDHATVAINAEGKIEAIDYGECDLDLEDAWLMPALVDSHVHGAMGLDTMDANHDALDGIACYLARHGVGAFAPTTVTAQPDAIEAALVQIRESKRTGTRGAEIVGAYLEGPYFTAKCCGAHPVPLMRPISVQELSHWYALSEGALNTVALAAELPGADAAIQWLQARGVRTLIGHSDASYDETTHALHAGAAGVVHCYNGMRGLHHRDPGVVGAGFDHRGAHIELIADGHHVHPAAARIALTCAGEAHLILISDAMRAAGMPDGQYALGTMTVTVTDGVARTDVGGLAGSTLNLLDAVRYAMQWFELPLERVWALASRNPALALRRPDLGVLAPGQTASMVALAPHLEGVRRTWVAGRLVHSS